MNKPYALLRSGFPFHATLGMRRVTTNPMDMTIGKDGILYVLNRSDGIGAEIRKTNWDDEDLGIIGSGLQWPVQMIIDDLEHLYISDEAKNKIIVFDTSGKEINSWGDYGTEEGEINRPSGICFDKDENLLVVNTFNHMISRFTKSGNHINSFGKKGQKEGFFNYPWGIAIDPTDGNYLISDWGNNRIQRFDSEGNFIKSFASKGDGLGELNGPAGIAVDSQGDIFVADRGNHRVVQYDNEGKYVDRFIGDSVLSKSARTYLMANARALRAREMSTLEQSRRFRAPASVRIYDDLMYVPDNGSHRIQDYKKEAYELQPDKILPDDGIPFLYTV